MDCTVTGDGVSNQFTFTLDTAGNIPYYRCIDALTQQRVAIYGGIQLQMQDAITVVVTFVIAPFSGVPLYLAIIAN